MTLMLVLIVVACVPSAPRQGSVLREAQDGGVLRVVTLNAPTTYYEGRDGLAGFEYDLANAYAAHLGLEAHFVVVATIEAGLQVLAAGQADIAAAGLSVTAARQTYLAFGPSYFSATPIVVCRRGVRQITSLADMADVRFAIATGSSFVELVPQSTMIVERSVEGLLADVAAKQMDCTIADDHVFALHRRYLPNLEVRIELGPGVPLAWAVAGGHSWRNRSFMRDLKHWMGKTETASLLETLKLRHFAVADTEFDYVDLSRLRRAMNSRLPKYRALFEQAGTRYRLPWTLLAALAWRESHWLPNATSPTGVRGLMMLTLVTAKEQGVSNRLDPAQSIRGGARYLAHLYRRLPDEISTDQRMSFALAAYNMGWGHMMDARTLVASRDGDPNQWQQVSLVLPELEQREVYQHLTHGYARGREGQAYVAAVLNFADIIEKAYAPIIEPNHEYSEPRQ